MKFKTGILIFILFIILLISFGNVAASESTGDVGYRAYGLLCGAGILEYDEGFDMQKKVDGEAFVKIYSAYFGSGITADSESILRKNAVLALAKHCTKAENTVFKITSFKDFGFIEPAFRDAYKKMCSNGYLDFTDEFLRPDDELTYSALLNMMSYFEESFLRTQNISIKNGQVSDSTSKDGTVIISVSQSDGDTDFRFKRGESFIVFKDSKLGYYNYNIKKGDKSDFYLKSDKIVFVSVNNADVLNENHEIFKSSVYLYNDYDKNIILKTNTASKYKVYKIDENTLIYSGKERKSLSDINTTLLDIDCYVITDKTTDIIKYINITDCQSVIAGKE